MSLKDGHTANDVFQAQDTSIIILHNKILQDKGRCALRPYSLATIPTYTPQL